MKRFALGLIFYIVLVHASGHKCPRAISTRPCKCTDEDGLTLQCWNLTSKNTLEGITRRTGNIHFKKLSIFESTLPLPTSFLLKKQIRSLDLVESNFTSAFLNATHRHSTPNSIEAVHLYNDRFADGLSWRQFLGLRRLRLLLAYKVEIRHLTYSFRMYVSKSLERVHLWKTGTCYLQDEVFAGFGELIDVRIQECQLKDLKRSYFPRPAKIQVLFFDGNQIESLPEDIFLHMPQLRSVDLSKNLLTSVSETVFGKVYKHLGDLSLSGNPITCNCNINWIVPLQGHRYLDGYCVAPESLKERSLVTLKGKDFQFCRENVTET